MLRSERTNERWKRQELWHYEESREEGHSYGFWVTKPNSWRFWVLAPSAAYWLAATLNDHLVGEKITHGLSNRKNRSLSLS